MQQSNTNHSTDKYQSNATDIFFTSRQLLTFNTKHCNTCVVHTLRGSI